ncbi:hypothetical protein [Kordia zhangzhouensis]|uniref:hypothetical protein n=1 Tax=Kordia zhangzhouensis TaxID=1620405 RepID=UPI0012F71EB8|nr:hypothetical protein [Kordia zhangzhouensis]
MKKQHLKNLKLNKKSISNFAKLIGGKNTVEPPARPIEASDIINCYTQQDASWCWE